MKTTIQLAKIGNSQGIRLNKQLLNRYGISNTLEIETTPDAIILRPIPNEKLSWAETYKEMEAANEDWSDWEAVAEDGLEYEN